MTSTDSGGSGGGSQGGCVGGSGRRVGLRLTERDRLLLRWIGEQYCVRMDLLGVLMARHSVNPAARAAVAARLAQRRVAAWRAGGLVVSRRFLADTPSTVWLTAEGMGTAGLAWRSFAPAFPTVAHRHATGVVRAYVESRGVESGWTWTCERELREDLAGGAHCPDALVTSTDPTGRTWRTAVEVELTRKHRPRVEQILRSVLERYDDVIYFAAPEAAPVVSAAAEAISATPQVRIRPYPVPDPLAAVA